MDIHPAILASSHALGEWPLCHVRLQDDARFPWLVLVPRWPDARELEDLPEAERARLVSEIVQAGAIVRAIGVALRRPAEKLNVGALGNITPQLHVHVIGRRTDDAAWPGPVWGVGTPEPYQSGHLTTAIGAARAAFSSGAE